MLYREVLRQLVKLKSFPKGFGLFSLGAEGFEEWFSMQVDLPVFLEEISSTDIAQTLQAQDRRINASFWSLLNNKLDNIESDDPNYFHTLANYDQLVCTDYESDSKWVHSERLQPTYNLLTLLIFMCNEPLGGEHTMITMLLVMTAELGIDGQKEVDASHFRDYCRRFLGRSEHHLEQGSEADPEDKRTIRYFLRKIDQIITMAKYFVSLLEYRRFLSRSTISYETPTENSSISRVLQALKGYVEIFTPDILPLLAQSALSNGLDAMLQDISSDISLVLSTETCFEYANTYSLTPHALSIVRVLCIATERGLIRNGLVSGYVLAALCDLYVPFFSRVPILLDGSEGNSRTFVVDSVERPQISSLLLEFASREQISSREFKDICLSYGIDQDSATFAWCDQLWLGATTIQGQIVSPDAQFTFTSNHRKIATSDHEAPLTEDNRRGRSIEREETEVVLEDDENEDEDEDEGDSASKDGLLSRCLHWCGVSKN